MKHLFLTFTCIIFAISLNAQAKYGIRGEYGFTSNQHEKQIVMSSYNAIDNVVDIQSLGNSSSVGLFSQFKFGFLFVQPEVLYTVYTNKYAVKAYDIETREKSLTINEKFQNIEMPITAGVNVGNMRLGFGPIFSYNLKNESDFTNLENVSVNNSKLLSAFSASFGYDYRNFHFDLRYVNGFNSVTEHISFDNAKYDLKSTLNRIKLGVAISL